VDEILSNLILIASEQLIKAGL